MKVLHQSLIYVVTSLGNKAIPFLLLPIITRYLSPSEYGLYALYQVFITFLTPFIGMSLEVHITRNYFRVERRDLAKIISAIFLLLHLNVVVALVLIALASLVVNQPLGLSHDVLQILPIIIYAQMINTFELGLLRNEGRPLRFGLTQITMSALNLSIALALLLSWKLGWKSLVFGLLAGQFGVALFSLRSMYLRGFIKRQIAPLWPLLRISAPLIIHLLGGSVIFLSDRLFIEHMLGLETVGVYSIGVQFGTIAMLVINAIMLAYGPWFFKHIAANDAQVVRRSYQLLVGFVLLGLGVWLAGYALLPWVVDDAYHSARAVIFWVVLGFVVRGFYQVFYNILLHEGLTQALPFITGSAALLNLLLNALLIHWYGMVGAAQATVLAFLVMFLLTWAVVQRKSPVWRRLRRRGQP